MSPVAAGEGTAPGGQPPVLELSSLRKSFDDVLAVDRCDLAMGRGEIVALLGPSGCGKSTLLNLVAGFETPDFGTIRIRGQVLNTVPPHRRNIAMVFQHYAMFPHMTVRDNIAYGLQVRKLDREQMRARVAEMVALLHLGGLEDRYPAQLSGGQRQRVAVARALAIRPDMLLLDEAFSALDRNLREEMQLELSLLLRRLMVTTIVVTHDQREAFALADRIAVMEAGRIVQIGAPEAVYRRPVSSHVLRFLGTTNRLDGMLAPDGDGRHVALAPGLGFRPHGALPADGAVTVHVRAEDVMLSAEPTPIHAASPAVVTLCTFLGAQERVVVEAGAQQIVIDRPAQMGAERMPLAPGQVVYLSFDPARCQLVGAS